MATKPKGLSEAAKTGKSFDDFGSAEILDIAALNVDTAYQRALRHNLVNQIGKEYDIVKAGPILVSERKDGSLWVVDGQHRMAGALQAGEDAMFAHVIHGLTKEQEADLRLARNNRMSDSTYEKFRTRLVMGDPVAHRMMELVRQQGTELNLEPNVHQGINALGTVEELYKVDNGETLVRVLKFINEAFDPSEDGRYAAAMMKGVAWFISQHISVKNEATWKEATSRFGGAGVDDIRRKAVSHKAANGGSLWLNYYRAMVELYNFRRQENKKLRWKVSGSSVQLGDDSTGPNSTAGGKRPSKGIN